MKVIWANQSFPENGISLFLAGPTPRSADVRSWRPDAVSLLSELGFDGNVFIPEDESGRWRHSYTDQVEWEDAGLHLATVIVFWVPRDLKHMPAFTTNVEWGTWHQSGKVVLGAPADAPKMSYLRYYATKFGVPQADTLRETLQNAIKLAKELSQ